MCLESAPGRQREGAQYEGQSYEEAEGQVIYIIHNTLLKKNFLQVNIQLHACKTDYKEIHAEQKKFGTSTAVSALNKMQMVKP